MSLERCFACDRMLLGPRRLVDTRDGQMVHVGPDCFAKVCSAGEGGYQPPKGGPKLYEVQS